MACGRPKNLEIAARNPLCGPGDERRNSPTTGTVTGEGGNPEPPVRGKPRTAAMGKSGPSGREEPGATGEEETLSRPARGKPRATRQWVISRPLATGEPGATRRGGNPVPPGKGKTSSQLAEGKTRVMRRE